MNLQEANVTSEQVIAIKEELSAHLMSDPFRQRFPELNVLTVVLAVSCLLSEIVGMNEEDPAENKRFINSFVAPLICASFDPMGTPVDLKH